METDHKNEMKYLPVKLLVPNPKNPQVMKPVDFSRLCDEIANNGFIVPIQVTPLPDGTYRIIGGEHRWRAAQVNQMEEIPCMILGESKWEDEDLQDFIMVRLNVLSGKVDPAKFMKLYDEKASKYGKEALQDLFSYSDAHAFQKLIGDTKNGMKKSLPKEMQGKFDELSKEAKTVEDLSKIIQQMFVKYGETLDQSFMIFTHGQAEHIFIAMDKSMKKSMEKVMKLCKLTGKNINEVMSPIFEALLREAEDRIATGEGKT